MNPPEVENVHIMLHPNLSGTLSIREIAATVSLREVRYQNLFFQNFGMSPAAWLHRSCLLSARRLPARSVANP